MEFRKINFLFFLLFNSCDCNRTVLGLFMADVVSGVSRVDSIGLSFDVLLSYLLKMHSVPVCLPLYPLRGFLFSFHLSCFRKAEVYRDCPSMMAWTLMHGQWFFPKVPSVFPQAVLVMFPELRSRIAPKFANACNRAPYTGR